MNQEFGKVAVLLGGWAAEREVSLNSGNAVLTALQAQGIDAHGVDVGRDIANVLQAGSFDHVFNIVHGRGGEDGQIQGLLDILQLPYTGCGLMASSISMDKLMTKNIWLGLGLCTPKYCVLDEEVNIDQVVGHLGLPVIVKPALEGSSIGMSKVDTADQLQAAYDLAKEYGAVFAEQWITGKEYTVAIVDGQVLPSICLQANNAFYDYEAKYQSDETQYFCPSGLNDAAEEEVQALAKEAFDAIGGRGWGRVDFMRHEDGKFYLIEVNTVPGMTSHSLVPMAAKTFGWDFQELVTRVLQTARFD
ncbi:MAG: D-alanine--D-alanine ligase (EC [uncultured Thiotrichaceae bacterium]|uniref:D-alanine--D-alanine ligase n=1 Tax=uncultured Thiotrichaceae bacterium TaxID=298394 RepID=A0A6S6TDQ6_9GAMM|nr:MAG: D-alanine--D-alanine ligase (EC [uncultured Thiotrichaceae bacterium]